MGRAPCCEKNGLKRGPWTPDEDQKLVGYIQKHGYGNWRTLPKNAGMLLFYTSVLMLRLSQVSICGHGVDGFSFLTLFRVAEVWKELSSSLD